MNIAFDAKRAFENNTGLGNYSRSLIASLIQAYPHHNYFLMAPKLTDMFKPLGGNVNIITPRGGHKMVPSLWRSKLVTKDLQRLHVDLYHGLSHEIPVGIEHTGIKTVVTIHDLIFEHYPGQYKPADVLIYRRKFKNACTHADKIIAISKQTKDDLIELYKVPEAKIEIVYQACDPKYQVHLSETEREQIRAKYKLPQQFFLSVGSVIERKGLLSICEALNTLKGKLDIPLVVIGTGGKYMDRVKAYIASNGLADRVIFLSEQSTSQEAGYVTGSDFPAIYQLSTALIYPSMYEGFGLPVAEALFSQTPVITSNVSCLPEAGGDAAMYVTPGSIAQLAAAMTTVATDSGLRSDMIKKGLAHARLFLPHYCAANTMKVYESLIK